MIPLLPQPDGRGTARTGGVTQPVCPSRTLVSFRPDLMWVHSVSTGQIIDQLEQLRDLIPGEWGDGDGR